MNPVFWDTVGFIALWDPSDDWHQAALESFKKLQENGVRGYTTSSILLECGNAAARRPYRDSVVRLKEKLEAADAIVYPTESDWREAWAAYRRGDGAQAGIVDQISFIVMRRLGIVRAFTNDKHFRAAGFEVMF